MLTISKVIGAAHFVSLLHPRSASLERYSPI